LAGPAISVILTDRRHLALTGKCFSLAPVEVREGKTISTVEVEFDACFSPGTYFITLRLESRGMGRNFLPVDKQPAALSFDVPPYEPKFLGTLDIGMRQG